MRKWSLDQGGSGRGEREKRETRGIYCDHVADRTCKLIGCRSKTQGSRMTPRFSAQASKWLQVPGTEIGKAVGDIDLAEGGASELLWNMLCLICQLDLQVEKSDQQLETPV